VENRGGGKEEGGGGVSYAGPCIWAEGLLVGTPRTRHRAVRALRQIEGKARLGHSMSGELHWDFS